MGECREQLRSLWRSRRSPRDSTEALRGNATREGGALSELQGGARLTQRGGDHPSSIDPHFLHLKPPHCLFPPPRFFPPRSTPFLFKGERDQCCFPLHSASPLPLCTRAFWHKAGAVPCDRTHC